VIALDFLFQIHVVRLEPCVQPFNLGNARAQRVLVAAALQRGTEDLGNELQAFDQQLLPSPCRRLALDHHRAATCRQPAGTPRMEHALADLSDPASHRVAGDLRVRDCHQLAAREARDQHSSGSPVAFSVMRGRGSRGNVRRKQCPPR
jgi:hypothetical protein